MLALLAKSGLVRGIGIGSAFLVNVLLVRLLELSDVGVFLIIMSLSLFLSILVRFGMKETALKYVASVNSEQGRGYVRDIVNKLLKVVLVGNVVLYVLYFSLGKYFSALFEFDYEILAYLALWTTALSFLIPVSNICRGIGWIVYGALLDNVLNNVLICVVFGVCLFVGYDCSLEFALSVAIGASLICLSAGLVVVYGKLPAISKKVKLPYLMLLNVSSLVWVTNICTYLLANAGLWLVGYFSNPEQAAFYGIALKIYNLLAFPLLIINISIEPRLVNLIKTSRHQEAIDLMRKTASLGFILSLCFYGVLLLYGPEFLIKAFGDEYRVSYMYLMILATGNLVHVWTGSSVNFLLLNGDQKVVANVTAIAAMFAFVFGYILTKKYGAIGMATTTAMVVVFQQIFIWRYLIKKGYKSHPYLNLKTLFPKHYKV